MCYYLFTLRCGMPFLSLATWRGWVLINIVLAPSEVIYYNGNRLTYNIIIYGLILNRFKHFNEIYANNPFSHNMCNISSNLLIFYEIECIFTLYRHLCIVFNYVYQYVG